VSFSVIALSFLREFGQGILARSRAAASDFTMTRLRAGLVDGPPTADANRGDIVGRAFRALISPSFKDSFGGASSAAYGGANLGNSPGIYRTGFRFNLGTWSVHYLIGANAPTACCLCHFQFAFTREKAFQARPSRIGLSLGLAPQWRNVLRQAGFYLLWIKPRGWGSALNRVFDRCIRHAADLVPHSQGRMEAIGRRMA